MNNPLVFLSYSSTDKDVVNKIAEYLKSKNINVWLDSENIHAGDSIPSKISEGLNECDAIVLIISKEYLKSPWCKAEYESILVDEIEKGLPRVIPVLIENVELPKLLNAKRSVYLSYHYSNNLYDHRAQELLKSILDKAANKNFFDKTDKEYRNYLWEKNSLIDLIITKLIYENSVSKLSSTQLSNGYLLVDLYRAIDRLVDSYIEMFDIIMRVFAKPSRYYKKEDVLELAIANRKLLSIARDARSLSSEFELIIKNKNQLGHPLKVISQLCTNITVLDWGGVQLLFGTPKNIPNDDELGEHGTLGVHYAPGISVWDIDLDNSKYPLDMKKMEECLSKLETYRNELRYEIGKL